MKSIYNAIITNSLNQILILCILPLQIYTDPVIYLRRLELLKKN